MQLTSPGCRMVLLILICWDLSVSCQFMISAAAATRHCAPSSHVGNVSIVTYRIVEKDMQSVAPVLL